jgi:crossover junction endodeoxyribonuclease RuvC
MGHARGVIVLAAAEAGLSVVSYPATQVKKTITGNGHAAKWQMQEAIRRELGLPSLPEPADVADALAIALCHCYLGTQESRIADCGLRIEEGQLAIRNPKTEIRNQLS